MTPPCPNCGTIFTAARSPDWRNQPVSIETFEIDNRAHDRDPFVGVEHRCNKCRHRWRVAMPQSENI